MVGKNRCMYTGYITLSHIYVFLQYKHHFTKQNNQTQEQLTGEVAWASWLQFAYPGRSLNLQVAPILRGVYGNNDC